MNNLKLLRQKHNLSTRDLGEKLSMTHTTISRLENGDSHFNNDYIQTFTSFFGVTADYLLGLPTIATIGDGSFKPVNLVKYRFNKDAEIEWEVIGNMIAKVDNPDDYVYVEIYDDKMEPTFIKGDIILIKKQGNAKNNQLVLANVNNTEVSIKRFKSIDNDHYLLNDNNKYDPFRITSNVDTVILGIVKSFTRNIEQ